MRNKMAAFGVILLGVIVGVTILAPLLTSQDPTIPHSLPGQPPSWTDPLGTTDQGYSVYAQVIYGGRISLVVAAVATLIAMTISITLGLFAAYCCGIVDDGINHAVAVIRLDWFGRTSEQFDDGLAGRLAECIPIGHVET